MQLETGEKEGWIFWDHTPTSKTGAINRGHGPAWLTKEDRDTEGVPSAGSLQFSIKVYCHRDLEKLEGGLNAKFQKRKPSRRTNGGFVNDVLSSWEEMKIEHIRNAIDTQRGVMLEIIEKQGGPTTFLSSSTSCKT